MESSSVSADFNNIFLTTKPSVPRQQVEKKSDLLRLHLLDSLDMKENGIKDFASLNTHVIMLLAKTGLLFYTRSALLKPLPEKKKALFDDENVGVISRAKSRSRTRRSIESSADEAVKKAAAAAASSKNTSVYQEFRHSSSLTISYYEAAREISSMRVMADQMVFVAYTDGLVQCIQYQSKHLQHDHSKDNSPSISDTSYNPANVLPSLVLCELFVSGKDKVPLFNMFLNTSCKTYGSCSFMMEFFMFTEDFKLSLYGVRQTDRRFIRTETVTITNEEDSSSIASKEEKAEVPRVASKGPAESVSTAYVETLDATIGTSYLAEFDLISVSFDIIYFSPNYLGGRINLIVCTNRSSKLRRGMPVFGKLSTLTGCCTTSSMLFWLIPTRAGNCYAM
ncbi:hypothetical protein EON64_00350 [archaeon]|nr:MAG: hypothetical protein EON64_00350 [archaeon]